MSIDYQQECEVALSVTTIAVFELSAVREYSSVARTHGWEFMGRACKSPGLFQRYFGIQKSTGARQLGKRLLKCCLALLI